MKKSFSDVVFILDMSGSMSNLESDVIGGYNSLLSKLKDMNENILVTTIVFNDKYNKVHDRVSLDNVTMMTSKEYNPSGCTALLDAIGNTIESLDESYKEKKADKTLIYITTDGMENSSRDFTYSMIRKMIKWHTEKDNWEFNFLAANIDEKEVASNLGINTKNAFKCDLDDKEDVDNVFNMCFSIAKESLGKNKKNS